jgi:Arc/MetJ-type ribon-helix-helix transcriptional regulator
MARIQVNLKLDEGVLREVEKLVEQGCFNTKTEAFTKALQLLIRTHKAGELAKRFEEVREGTEEVSSLTEAVIESHGEEDDL